MRAYKNEKRVSRLYGGVAAIALWSLVNPSLLGGPAAAQDEGQSEESNVGIEEIIVTARKRSESLANVPDAITAFTATQIQDARINEVVDFVNRTPNIIFRETFRPGVTFVTMRGITTGQQGLPPVSFVVDGVQVSALDFINQQLVDVERIEVLRGPQGALYGTGAIAGAINIVTQKPTMDWSGDVFAGVGKGNDYRASGNISGPLLGDNVRFRLSSFYRNTDGLIDSAQGEDLDFEETYVVRGRIAMDFNRLAIDLKANFQSSDEGAAFQDTVAPDEDGNFDPDDFSGPGPDRGLIGSSDREIWEVSAKVDYDFGPAQFTSVTGYSNADQDTVGDLDFSSEDILNLGAVIPGAVGLAQILRDDFKSVNQEVRLSSPGSQRFRWLVGGFFQHRRAVNGLNTPAQLMGGGFGPPILDLRADVRKDDIWALFSQVSYDLTDRLEITAALRFDEDNFSTRKFTDFTLTEMASDIPGEPAFQERTDNSLQPKVQLSYDWRDNLMTYFTYAEGFRPGFFNSGQLTLAEDTENYEIGYKGSFWNGRIKYSGAFFMIDFSNQQFTTVVPEPPFRITENIPATDIKGLEFEGQARLGRNLDLNWGLGVIDSKVKDGTEAPATPDHTFNIGATYIHDLTGDWSLILRGDYRRQGSHFLARNNQFQVDAKNFIDGSINVESAHWKLGFWVKNALNSRVATDFTPFLGGVAVRAFNMPVSWGFDARYSF